jgi:hypothetical protein
MTEQAPIHLGPESSPEDLWDVLQPQFVANLRKRFMELQLDFLIDPKNALEFVGEEGFKANLIKFLQEVFLESLQSVLHGKNRKNSVIIREINEPGLEKLVDFYPQSDLGHGPIFFPGYGFSLKVGLDFFPQQDQQADQFLILYQVESGAGVNSFLDLDRDGLLNLEIDVEYKRLVKEFSQAFLIEDGDELPSEIWYFLEQIAINNTMLEGEHNQELFIAFLVNILTYLGLVDELKAYMNEEDWDAEFDDDNDFWLMGADGGMENELDPKMVDDIRNKLEDVDEDSDEENLAEAGVPSIFTEFINQLEFPVDAFDEEDDDDYR